MTIVKYDFEVYAELIYAPEERERWIAGELQDEWFHDYPQLFDEDDLRITRKQRRKHYFEWKAAIHLYENEGWYALVEKYRCKNHKVKQAKLKQILPGSDGQKVIEFMRTAKSNCPDILAYRPDFSDFCFAEVKGGADRLRASQVEHFNRLSEITGKSVQLVVFKPVR